MSSSNYYVCVEEAEKLAGLTLLWVPLAVLRSRRGQEFLVDCYVSGVLKSAVARVLLTHRVQTTIRLCGTMSPMAPQAPALRCTPEDFLDDVRSVKAFVEGSAEARPGGWAELLDPGRLALAHTLSAVKWILGPMESLPVEIGRGISRSILADMLEIINVYDATDVVSWTIVHALFALNPKKKRVDVVVGRARLKSEPYAKYMFGNPTVREELKRLLGVEAQGL